MSRVWVERSVLRDTLRLAEGAVPYETGGLLLGYTSPEGETVILGYVGAGPGAAHQDDSFEPDHEWRTSELSRLYHESEGLLGYLGDWHSHPTSAGRPSRRDLRTMRLIAGTPSARAPSPLFGIVETGTAGLTGRFRLWRWAPTRLLGPLLRAAADEVDYDVFDQPDSA